MSRRIKNIELVINGKIIKKDKIEKYSMFKSRKYIKFVKKKELSIHKIDQIEIIPFKKSKTVCKENNYLNVLFFSLFLILFLYSISFLKYNNYNSIVFRYKEYNLGEKIVYDNEYWYVINDSTVDTDILKLLLEKEYDFNQDGIINSSDKVKFDYNKIKMSLNKTYSKSRILTSYEYIDIRDKMSFGYFWEKDNFLAGKNLFDWWIDTKNPSKLYSITESGCFKENKEEDVNYIRPVVEISKLDFPKI